MTTEIKYIYLDERSSLPTCGYQSKYYGFLAKVENGTIHFFLRRNNITNKWLKYNTSSTFNYSKLIDNKIYCYRIKKFYTDKKSFIEEHFEKLLAKE